MLGGDGGDELFGAALLSARRPPARRTSAAGADARPRAAGRAATVPRAGRSPGSSARWPWPALCPIACTTSCDDRSPAVSTPDWLRPQAVRDLLASDDPLAWKRLDGPRWWAHVAHGLTRGVEEAGVFEHQRRRAALAGLEARHPLFDLDLLELAPAPAAVGAPSTVIATAPCCARDGGPAPRRGAAAPQKAWFDSLIVDCLAGPDARGPDATAHRPHRRARRLRRPRRDAAHAARQRPRPSVRSFSLDAPGAGGCHGRVLAAHPSAGGEETLRAELQASAPRVTLRSVSI